MVQGPIPFEIPIIYVDVQETVGVLQKAANRQGENP